MNSSTPPRLRYKRILLKISGEALQKGSKNIEPEIIESLAKEIKQLLAWKLELAIVIGGGNIFRGLSASGIGMDRSQADYMGMLATMINGLAIQDIFEKNGIETRVLSALELKSIAEPYIRRRALRHIEKGRAIIFAAGTGNPYFTTDTAASLRAMEINAEVLIKATKVDGIYDKDPVKSSDSVMYHHLSYIDVLNQNLKVMDSTAISMCMDNSLPIVVLNMTKANNLSRFLMGEDVGTLVDKNGKHS